MITVIWIFFRDRTKMGASVSTNVNELATNAITKVASEVVQKSNNDEDESQIISVTDVDGDVEISDNIITQRIDINLENLFDTLATDLVQEKLAANISQQAKALISGINLAQFSAATNIMKTYINAVIDISKTVGQHCSSSSNQHQSIIVKNVRGTTRIDNNVIDQITNVIQKCIAHSVNQNETLQSVATTLQQLSSSSSIGISEWALFAFLCLLIGAPIVGGVYVLKYTFPVLMIVGIGVISWYMWSTKEDMKLTSFSQMVKNSCDPVTAVPPVYNVYTAEDAANKCLADEMCKAFDFKINKKSNVKTTTLYTDIPTDCEKIKTNDKELTSGIQLADGDGMPTSKGSQLKDMVPYDVYVDTNTTKWYQLNENGIWETNDKLIEHKELDAIVIVTGYENVNSNVDVPDHDLAYVIQLTPSDLSYWNIYKKVGNKWEAQPSLRKQGPENRKIVARIPSAFNVSGIKTVHRKQWLLYLGIALTLVGIIGTGYTTLTSSTTTTTSRGD